MRLIKVKLLHFMKVEIRNLNQKQKDEVIRNQIHKPELRNRERLFNLTNHQKVKLND